MINIEGKLKTAKNDDSSVGEGGDSKRGTREKRMGDGKSRWR